MSPAPSTRAGIRAAWNAMSAVSACAAGADVVAEPATRRASRSASPQRSRLTRSSPA